MHAALPIQMLMLMLLQVFVEPLTAQLSLRCSTRRQ